MVDLATVVPAGASGGALVAVVWYLLRSNASDRRDYLDSIDRANVRADAMAGRAAAAETALDAERERRRRWEDAAATAQRELARFRARTGSTDESG